MKSITFITSCITLILGGCKNGNNNNKINSSDTSIEIVETIMGEPQYPPLLFWIDSGKVKLGIQSELKYTTRAFKSDSVIAIDYESSPRQNIYFPINDNGQWLNTIHKRKKLTESQIDSINEILANKESFDNPMKVNIYLPTMAFIYFKNGKVIAQSIVSILGGKLESTAKIRTGKYPISFNKMAIRRLEKICAELNFSGCHIWPN